MATTLDVTLAHQGQMRGNIFYHTYGFSESARVISFGIHGDWNLLDSGTVHSPDGNNIASLFIEWRGDGVQVDFVNPGFGIEVYLITTRQWALDNGFPTFLNRNDAHDTVDGEEYNATFPLYLILRNDDDTADVSTLTFYPSLANIAAFPYRVPANADYYLFGHVTESDIANHEFNSNNPGLVWQTPDDTSFVQTSALLPILGNPTATNLLPNNKRNKYRFERAFLPGFTNIAFPRFRAKSGTALQIAPDAPVGLLQTDIRKRFILNRPVSKIYLGTRSTPYWQQGATPTITSFTVSPTTIDLDTRATGNITLTFGVTGSTSNRIHNKETGQNIPLTTPTTAIIAQPDKPTTYVLVCTNDTGGISREVTVDVTKNAAITNFRRTGFYQSRFGTSSGVFRFGARITGLPQPALTYNFSTGEQGSICLLYTSPSPRD